MAGLERINGLETRTPMSSSQEEKEGVIYEPETSRKPEYKTLEQTKAEVAREEAAAAKANLHSRFDGPGVAVELSAEAIRASEAEKKGSQSILDILKETWDKIATFFRDLWTGGEEQAANGERTVEDSEAFATTDASMADKHMDSLQKEKSIEKAEDIVAFMADYGGKKLAKNSDLLTQYDRSGKIISPSASDRRRILQGEGKVQHY